MSKIVTEMYDVFFHASFFYVAAVDIVDPYDRTLRSSCVSADRKTRIEVRLCV